MTIVSNSQHLGKFFHDIRVGRGVTLKAASGDWSSATLSRFERGEQDISTDKAVELMVRLGIEFSDFFLFYEAQPANFPMAILNYSLSYHNQLISKRKAAYFAAHPTANAITEYAGVLFDVAERWQSSDYHLSSAQEQCLADRLAVPEQFDMIESEALKLVCGVASHEFLCLMKHRLERLDSQWHNRDMRLLSIWLGALMTHDLALADPLQVYLQPLFTQGETEMLITQYNSNWQFGVAASAWLHEPTPQHADAVEAIIADQLMMNNRDDGNWFKNMFARMQFGQVRHNPELVDHPQLLQVSHHAGEVVKQRRHCMGVSVEDLVDTVSPTTLRRFEAGQTQLAFSVMVDLMGVLGFMPSQVLNNLNRTPNHPNGVLGLAATYLKISKLDSKAAQAEITRFTLVDLQKPEQILGIQLFVLHCAAKIADQRLAAEAQVVFKQLLNINTWYRLELLALNSVVKWLTVTQLGLLFDHAHRLLDQQPALMGIISYLYDAASQAIVQVVKHAPAEIAKDFVQQLRWLIQKDTETPGAWLATGSWLLAMAVLVPADPTRDAVAQYFKRSQRAGHLEAIAELKRTWRGIADPALLK